MNKEQMEKDFQDGINMIKEVIFDIPRNKDEFDKLKKEYLEGTHILIPQEAECRICGTTAICLNSTNDPICFSCAEHRADRMNEIIATWEWKDETETE